MNRPRPLVARFSPVVAAFLGAASLALSGCFSQSEGRPAGSIEVNFEKTSSQNAAIEAAQAKAQAPPRGR